jgi:hypothetical protein
VGELGDLLEVQDLPEYVGELGDLLEVQDLPEYVGVLGDPLEELKESKPYLSIWSTG